MNYVSGARQQPHFPFRAYMLQSERRAGYVPLGSGLGCSDAGRVGYQWEHKDKKASTDPLHKVI